MMYVMALNKHKEMFIYFCNVSIGVHEMHVNYTVITYTHLADGKLPIKSLVARQRPTNAHAHIHVLSWTL